MFVLKLVSLLLASLSCPNTGHEGREPSCCSKNPQICPNWCDSVCWALFQESKGCRFNPSRGTCLGYGFGPRLGYVWEATDQCFSLTSMFFSLSFSLPFPLSKKITKYNLKKPISESFLFTLTGFHALCLHVCFPISLWQDVYSDLVFLIFILCRNSSCVFSKGAMPYTLVPTQRSKLILTVLQSSLYPVI